MFQQSCKWPTLTCARFRYRLLNVAFVYLYVAFIHLCIFAPSSMHSPEDVKSGPRDLISTGTQTLPTAKPTKK
jgi:hypothetical protein